MKYFKTMFLPVFIAAVWISISEFARNELLFKSYWVVHYEKLGMVFPSEPVNGIVWGVWSILYAIAIFIISRKFSLIQTALLSWFVGFVLMWTVIWNMNVFPLEILIYAIPLSLVEVYIATFLIVQFKEKYNN